MPTKLDDLGTELPRIDPIASERKRGGPVAGWPGNDLVRQTCLAIALLEFAALALFVGAQPSAVLIVAVTGLHWYRQVVRRRAVLSGFHPILVRAGRCGACARPFSTTDLTSSGHVRCAECGAAWHRDRISRESTTVSCLIDRERQASWFRLRSRRFELDDRGLPLPAPLSIPRGYKALLLAVWGGVILLVCAYRLAGGTDTLWNKWLWYDAVFAGALAVLLVLMLLHDGHRPQQHLDSVRGGVCPDCLDDLTRAPLEFDGCVTCECRAAWKADRIAVPRSGDTRARRKFGDPEPEESTMACPRCGYEKPQYRRCPECAYPDRHDRPQRRTPPPL